MTLTLLRRGLDLQPQVLKGNIFRDVYFGRLYNFMGWCIVRPDLPWALLNGVLHHLAKSSDFAKKKNKHTRKNHVV